MARVPAKQSIKINGTHEFSFGNPDALSLTLFCVFANAHRYAIRVIPCNYYTNLINGLTAVMDVVKTVHGAEFGFAFPSTVYRGVISRETMRWL